MTWRCSKYVTYTMLFHLDILTGAIFKGPPNDISFWTGTLDFFTIFKSIPEVMKALQLNQVPNLGNMGRNKRAFHHRGGGWDRWLRHLHGYQILVVYGMTESQVER